MRREAKRNAPSRLHFYDKLKSYSSGYASFDWEVTDYQQGDLIKLTMFINGEKIVGVKPYYELKEILKKHGAK